MNRKSNPVVSANKVTSSIQIRKRGSASPVMDSIEKKLKTSDASSQKSKTIASQIGSRRSSLTSRQDNLASKKHSTTDCSSSSKAFSDPTTSFSRKPSKESLLEKSHSSQTSKSCHPRSSLLKPKLSSSPNSEKIITEIKKEIINEKKVMNKECTDRKISISNIAKETTSNLVAKNKNSAPNTARNLPNRDRVSSNPTLKTKSSSKDSCMITRSKDLNASNKTKAILTPDKSADQAAAVISTQNIKPTNSQSTDILEEEPNTSERALENESCQEKEPSTSKPKLKKAQAFCESNFPFF